MSETPKAKTMGEAWAVLDRHGVPRTLTSWFPVANALLRLEEQVTLLKAELVERELLAELRQAVQEEPESASLARALRDAEARTGGPR